MDRTRLQALLDHAIAASLKAGHEILKIYETDFAVEHKKDNSPLTLADMNAHKTITVYLKEAEAVTDMSIPILSEEGRDITYEERRHWEYFWLVDPLDGTKEFIKRNGEFTVNIALVHKHNPVLGVIYIPVKDTLYFAAKTMGVYRLDSAFRIFPDDIATARTASVSLNHPPVIGLNNPVRIVGSRSHSNPIVDEFIGRIRDSFGDVEFLSAGSSLKFCLIAEGSAILYPRFGPTMEWDTAAGQAIVECSGGRVLDIRTGNPLIYNKEVLKNPHFIATGNLADNTLKGLLELFPRG